MKNLAVLGLTMALATPASADITARFIESAPKDRFILENTGSCVETDLTLTIDLSQSAAGLIFDTTGAGAGVEVFQPFELVTGGNLVPNAPTVSDGMNSVTLNVPSFPAGAKIAFTVDVDDTMTSSDLGQIRVSGSEIKGAVVKAGTDQAAFSANATATIARNACNA